MFDHVYLNGISTHGNKVNLAVQGDRYADIGPDIIPSPGTATTDLEGRLVLPGFVDGHIHLDKSFVGDRWRPHRPVANLRERLAVEKQALACARPVIERAHALIRQAVEFGTVAMRSHVDVDAATGLTHLHAVMEAREKWRDIVDIELVAFPQAGVMSCAGTADILEAAVQDGAQVIGGIDPTTLDGDAEGQLDVVFGIAEKHGVKVDIHLHEPGRQGIEQLHRIAARTRASGLEGRVAVSHAYALGEVAHDLLNDTAAALAQAGVAIMTVAPGARPFPPILQLMASGVNVFAGNDNIQDAWSPYGTGDMLQRAMLIGYRSGFYTDADLQVALHMVTEASASVMQKADYGLKVGCPATFVAIKAPNAAAAVAAAPQDRLLVHRGRPYKHPPA